MSRLRPAARQARIEGPGSAATTPATGSATPTKARRDCRHRQARRAPARSSTAKLAGRPARSARAVVLQGIDTAGKDGTIEHFFGAIDPRRCASRRSRRRARRSWRTTSSGASTTPCPQRGEIGIFNRSHYEDVLVVRVDKLVPEGGLEQRYDQINAFEQHAGRRTARRSSSSSCTSRKEEQAERLQERLDDPRSAGSSSPTTSTSASSGTTTWTAYERDARAASTEWAPWYVVPADRKWVRNAVVSDILVQALERLDMKWPALDPAVKALTVE